MADSTDREIRVKAKYIAALAPFLSDKNEPRYYLNGIFIEPHPDRGCILVAANGHVMGIIHDMDGVANDGYICKIPPGMIKACIPKKRDYIGYQAFFSGDVCGVVPDGQTAALTMGPEHRFYAYAPAVDGVYPKWHAIPKQRMNIKPMLSITGVNPAYIGMLEKTAKALEARNGAVILNIASARESILATILDHDEFLGIIMPIGLRDNPPCYMPGWLTRFIDSKEAL